MAAEGGAAPSEQKDDERTEELCELFDKVIRGVWTKKQKPHEWTVAAAFVAEDTATRKRAVLAAGFGTKCPGKEHYDTGGCVLHDCHAETLARRALIFYFLQEIYSDIRHGNELKWLERCANSDSMTLPAPSSSASDQCLKVPQYRLRETTTLTLLLSELPCGDAAIVPDSVEKHKEPEQEGEHRAKRQKVEATSNGNGRSVGGVYHRATGAKPLDTSSSNENEQVPGYVRLKPGRTDLPDRLKSESISCTDKLTRWHFIGFQGALLATLLSEPIRVSSYVLALSPCAPYSTNTALKSMEQAMTQRRTDMHARDATFRAQPFSLDIHRYRSENLDPSPLSMTFVGNSNPSPFTATTLDRDFPTLSKAVGRRREKKIVLRFTPTVSNMAVTVEGTLEVVIGHRGLIEGAGKKSCLQQVQSRVSKLCLFFIWAAIAQRYQEQQHLSDHVLLNHYKTVKRSVNGYSDKKERFHSPCGTKRHIFSLWKSKKDRYDAFSLGNQKGTR
eukprot:gb/GECG01004044.1/.p1 GENE.gb/GECG01004044.1/~~gb/GECG01004044.1/.p1  ORF type:complete len:502 (+),score=55.66 gb/GECG01004044.1/:1-1506(+)